MASQVLSSTSLPQYILAELWNLVDTRKRGALDAEEFALAMYLVRQVQANTPLPKVLPANFIPPSQTRTTAMPAQSPAATSDFEMRRRENMSAADAELQRRRQAMEEQERARQREEAERCVYTLCVSCVSKFLFSQAAAERVRREATEKREAAIRAENERRQEEYNRKRRDQELQAIRTEIELQRYAEMRWRAVTNDGAVYFSRQKEQVGMEYARIKMSHDEETAKLKELQAKAEVRAWNFSLCGY